MLPGDNQRVIRAGEPEVVCPTALDARSLAQQNRLQKQRRFVVARVELIQPVERPRSYGKEPCDRPVTTTAWLQVNILRSVNRCRPIDMLVCQPGGVVELARVLEVVRTPYLGHGFDALPIDDRERRVTLEQHGNARLRSRRKLKGKLRFIRREHGRVDDAAIQKNRFAIGDVQARPRPFSVSDLGRDTQNADRQQHARKPQTIGFPPGKADDD